jgi:non-ribosomal peptide synthetase component E (peptide arylation enzyme)
VRLDGERAAAGEEGELRVRGPQLMRGYVDASLDADAFDAEGFFRTGDLGRIDADGYVVVTGRLKDVIIRKGENISALEVESFLFEHPKIADVSVVGLPDTERGELCCAVVVCEEGARLEFEEMFDFLRERGLMLQKIPERLECVDSLPRNPSGKVLKRHLIARFSS